MQKNTPIKKIIRTIKSCGPGIITGAADNDPSGIGTYSMAGAKYGLSIIWLIPFQLPLMFVIQEMCARIGVTTGLGLVANMKKFFPKGLVYSSLIILVIANTVNIGADIAIMASSANLILGIPKMIWAPLFSIIIMITQIIIPYKRYRNMLLWTSLFLGAYIITALMTSHNWSLILQQAFIPRLIFKKDFIVLATGVIGTTISPYLFFWQTSQEIEELKDKSDFYNREKLQKNTIKKIKIDTFIGMFFSQIIAFFIMITCFAALHLKGITEIESAADAALALRPLVGDSAFMLFACGIIGAGLLGIPVLAGSTAYALSELFNRKASLSYRFSEAPFFYGTIIASILAGLFINIININPMKALLYAAVINGIATIPFIIFIILIANKKEVMGDYTNGHLTNAAGWTTCGLMIITALFLFI